MSATTALLEALNQGISSGNLVDTKIILYSHRDSSSRVCRPRVLYANSHVLKTVPYFNDLLFGNFAEAQSKDFNKETIDEKESVEDYGYLSDSDLEDDDDGRVVPVTVPRDEKVIPSQKVDLAAVRREEKRIFRQNVDLAAVPREEKMIPCKKFDLITDLFAVPLEEKKISCEEHEERIEKGKIVKIPDMAFVTFQAFLMYLYTNVIEFAPFGSEENRRSRSAEIITPSEVKVPRPSPKSIYRLADKYDVPALKSLALNHIRGGLAKCDIVEEAFSKFASRYDEIRSIYIDQLASVWMNNSTTETTRASFDKKVDSFAEGELEHATEMLSALWGIINKDGQIKTPSNTSPATAEATSPAHWATVTIALIRSIGKGVFFDRKYWARHSKAGGDLKPVYFSSTIMGDKVQQLNNLVIYHKGRNALINYPGGDANVDSDCERDLMGVGDGISKTREEKEEQARAVLTTGSFSAWKSLFFYRCTDTISFAPLRSQGVDSRLNYIRERSTTAAPPPCSPKTIYVLASLLGIQPLCDSAFANIKSKVSPDNVVGEVFSWVTASQVKVMDMECDLLISNFKNPKTVALMQESIGHISDGSSSHCASALKLGFKKAFELKKRESGVLLRCSNYNCGWYSNPVPYSSVGSNIYCPQCRRNRYMQCVGCGYQRTSNYVSCQSCGKKF